MNLTINSYNGQKSSYRQNFKALVPKEDALAIIANLPDHGQKGRASVYKSCAEIIGPDGLALGMHNAIPRCAYILQKQFIELENVGQGLEKYSPDANIVSKWFKEQLFKIKPKEFDVKPQYKETEETKSWLADAQKALGRIKNNN